MTLIIFIVLAVILIGSKYNFKGSFNDYLNIKQTTAINGIFVMLVFFRHFNQYIECGNFDFLFFKIDSLFGQLIVTTFLFYSGYGIMVSIKNKEDYARKMPKRIIRVWLKFAIAVCLFIVLNLLMKNEYSVTRILLSFTAWDSIGNSNWYIFAILMMYISTYFAALLTKNHGSRIILIVTIAALVYCIVLKLVNQEDWWYNTIFCYPLGLAFAEFQKPIDSFLDNNKKYLSTFITLIITFVISYVASRKLPGAFYDLFSLIFYELSALTFVLLIVLVTRKVCFSNKILDFLGKNTFEIYILQRLPMIALAPLGLNKYLYFAASFSITIILSFIFKQVTKKVFAVIKL